MSISRRQWLVPSILGALALVVAVVVGVLAWQSLSDSRTEAAQAQALDTARSSAAQILSYDAKTLDTDVEKSRKLVSGEFAVSFEQLVATVIDPVVKQAGLSNKATVTRAAVIDSRPDQLDALLFVNQTSTAPAQPQPASVMNQIKVTMTKVGDQWLVSGMQPL